MKLVWKLILIIAGIIFPLIFMIIVPIVILNQSWWWFFGTLIGEAFFGFIIGAVLIILFLRKKEPPKIKLDITSAKARAVHEFKYDTDNPDNFKIKQSKLERWGEKGADKTPILILEGIGTEKQENRCAIINLNNPKQEMTRLIDPSQEEIERAKRLMAEHPPEEEIREETTIGLDSLGRPVPITVKTTKPSSITTKTEKEQKEAEEQNIL